MIARNLHILWLVLRAFFLELVCAARFTITITITMWDCHMVGSPGQAGSVKLSKQRGIRPGERESPSIKATRSPAGIPRPIIIASKLIFIFDKKTRSEEGTGGTGVRSSCFGSSHLLLLLLLVKLNAEEGKTLFISENWKVRLESTNCCRGETRQPARQAMQIWQHHH